jgi:hypothetical protein
MAGLFNRCRIDNWARRGLQRRNNQHHGAGEGAIHGESMLP